MLGGRHADVHRRLVLAADDGTHEQLRAALASLATGIAQAGYTCRPLVVQHTADHLDVLMDPPTLPAVDEWKSDTENGEVWTQPGQPADGLPPIEHETDWEPTPLLVSLGEPGDGGQLYLDLEAARVVSLTGAADVAHGVARSMIAELAHSPLAGSARLVTVGDLGVARTDDLDHSRSVETWDTIGSNLLAWAEQSRAALAANEWPNPFVARALEGADHPALLPLVVIAGSPPDDSDVLHALIDAGPAAVAVVVVGRPIEGGTTIECSSNRLVVSELGLECRPQPVEPEFVDAVVELLEDAADPGADDLPLPAPAGSGHRPDDVVDVDQSPYEDPPHEVLVRVLGEITVTGTDRPLSPIQTAVVAYITLHGSATSERLQEAIWGNSPTNSPRKRLANTVSEARDILGPELLPIAVDRRYTTGAGLTTDVDLFERRVQAAMRQQQREAMRTLQGALDLVRGPVFTDRDDDRASFAWVDVEN
ncbi:MAG: hypothetical protein ACRD2C_14415 [Acidimicrobiales bacterium]